MAKALRRCGLGPKGTCRDPPPGWSSVVPALAAFVLFFCLLRGLSTLVTAGALRLLADFPGSSSVRERDVQQEPQQVSQSSKKGHLSHVAGQHHCGILTVRLTQACTYDHTRGSSCCTASGSTTVTWSAPAGFLYTGPGVPVCSIVWAHVSWGTHRRRLLRRCRGLPRLYTSRTLTLLRVHA